MKKLNLLAYPIVAALSLVAATAAFADDITPDDTATAKFATTKTRDQVQRELFQARADGSVKVWSTSYNPFAAFKGSKTRDEVRADAIAANRADFDRAYLGEDSGSFALNRRAPARIAAPAYAQK